MHKLFGIAALALLGGCMTADQPGTTAEAHAAAEAQFAAATAGRAPGQPVSCVSLTQLGSNRAVGPNMVLFEGPGSRLYVNRTSGCEGLRNNGALVIQSPNGQLCRGDIVRVVDLASNVDQGSCAMGAFVPYSRR